MSRKSADNTPEYAITRLYTAQPVFNAAKKRIAIALQQRSQHGVKPFELNETDTVLLQGVCQQLDECINLYQSDVIIGVSQQLLRAKVALALQANRVILLLSAVDTVDDTLLTALRWYKTQGYRLLCDDSNVNNNNGALIALVDIIRFDIQVTRLDDLQRHQRMYNRPELLWLADKVETEAQFSLFNSLGCSLYQGYFLPDKLDVAGKKITPGAVKLADIMRCLFDAEPDLNQLATVLQDEPAIVMGMLKVANSPLYRKAREVSSIKDVVTRLGLALSQKLVLTYAVLENSTAPAALTVLTRAYTAQRIAGQWQFDNKQQQHFFLAALLSGTDMLFGVAPETFLSHLNVTVQIEAALRQQSGAIGEALALVKRLERGNALKRSADVSELGYLTLYNIELANMQQRLARL